MELLQTALWGLGGGALGIVIGGACLIPLKLLGRRYNLVAQIMRRTRMYWLVLTGLLLTLVLFALNAPTAASEGSEDLFKWFGYIEHILAVCIIFAATALIYAGVGVIEEIAKRYSADTRSSRRLETQAQVVQRILRIVVVVLGIVFVLLTFPAARAPMASLLASAGIVSVVAGIAAQSTLGNLFAGLQLAFTDAIRVGDTVVVSNNQGIIEEITLSYVVVRLWDERRLLMPCTEFTSKAFENWSHTSPKQLGTIELRVDWSTPIGQIREHAKELVTHSDLWDGRKWSVQVTESDGQSMLVRIVVSAANPSKLWELRCYVRESLIKWLVDEVPHSFTRERISSFTPGTATALIPTDTVTVGEADATDEANPKIAAANRTAALPPRSTNTDTGTSSHQ